MDENNIQYVDLLKNKTTSITVNELPSSRSNRCRTSFKMKLIAAIVFLTSLFIFFCGILVYTEAMSVVESNAVQTATPSVFSPSLGSTSQTHSELLVGLPGQGFLLGSRASTAWTNKTVLQFLGIPYAEAPSGIRRFKPPTPKASWKGVLDASLHGRPCPAISMLNRTILNATSNYDPEDCLTLNVFTKDKKANHPVMVYIHGGAFIMGSAAEFPPNFLLEADIVLVVLQYRLGVLGFVSTQSKEIPGNAAIHDVILGLKWTQKYAQFFGGDPNKVTIFGQSAGSAICNLLMLTPVLQNSKLFHQAIAQSGTILSQWAVNEKPHAFAKHVCQQLCGNDLNHCSTTDNINSCLTKADVKDLVQITSSDISIMLDDFEGILPKPAKYLIDSVKPKYPLMTGATKHDGSFILADYYDLLIGKNKNVKGVDLFRGIIERLHGDSAGIIYNLLYREIFVKRNQTKQTLGELIPEFFDLISTLYFKSPTLTFAEMITPYNKNRTYLYTFDYEGAHTRFGYGASVEHYPFNGGVHHSDDNMYLFPYYFKNLNENDTAMAMDMVNIWTSFAITGVPRVNARLSIPAISAEARERPYLHINTNSTIGTDYSDEFFAAINDPYSYRLTKNQTLE